MKITFWHTSSGYNELVAKKFSRSSDLMFKTDIQPIADAVSVIKNLNGYSYNYKEPEFDVSSMEYGVIAQEVESVLPELVSTLNNGVKTVDYAGFVPFLIEAVKEQQTVIEDLQATIEMLNDKISSLEFCCDVNSIVEKKKSVMVENYELKVYQNAPNPFSENTSIQCFVPERYSKVQLCIFDMQGSQVKCVEISDRGDVLVKIDANSMNPGVYTYVLVGDVRTSEAKQMILTK